VNVAIDALLRCYPVTPACPAVATPAALPAGGLNSNGSVNPLGLLNPDLSVLTDHLPQIGLIALGIAVGLVVLSVAWKLLRVFLADREEAGYQQRAIDDPVNAKFWRGE
jgi:hypothetical protein